MDQGNSFNLQYCRFYCANISEKLRVLIPICQFVPDNFISAIIFHAYFKYLKYKKYKVTVSYDILVDYFTRLLSRYLLSKARFRLDSKRFDFLRFFVFPWNFSPSMRTEKFLFLRNRCENVEKFRELNGANLPILRNPYFTWQSTLRPDTDKKFDHFRDHSRAMFPILGQVFPATGIKGGEFMAVYSMHLPGRKIHVCSTFSGNFEIKVVLLYLWRLSR